MKQEIYYSGITYFLSIALLFVWSVLLLMKFINRKMENVGYDYWGDKAEFINSLGIIGIILFIIYSSYKSFSISFYAISQSFFILCVLIYFSFEYKINKKIQED